MSHVLQFSFTIVTGFLQIKSLSRSLPQMVLCFAGERVFPEGCSMEHLPSDHQPLSPAALHHHLVFPRVPPSSCPLLSPGSEAAEGWLPAHFPSEWLPSLSLHMCTLQPKRAWGWQCRSPGASWSTSPHLTSSHRTTCGAREGIHSLVWEKHLTFQHSKAFDCEWREKSSSPEEAINMPIFFHPKLFQICLKLFLTKPFNVQNVLYLMLKRVWAHVETGTLSSTTRNSLVFSGGQLAVDTRCLALCPERGWHEVSHLSSAQGQNACYLFLCSHIPLLISVA